MEKNLTLKLYVDGVMKVQKMYGWMMDNYVLDFFTKDLWGKLPRNWSDVLGSLQPEEIAYFFFEMFSPAKRTLDSRSKFRYFRKIKKKVLRVKRTVFALQMKSALQRRVSLPANFYRKVWPLELLAFIASCHALKLSNQTWIRSQKSAHKSCVPVPKNPNSNKTFDSNRETRCCKNPTNFKNDPGRTSAKKETDDTRNEKEFCGGGNLILSHPFQCRIKPKKLYEIDILSQVIFELTEKLQCWNIVDVGAGLGHLSRFLSFGYKLRVVTIEGDGCHQKVAEKIDMKVLHRLRKQEKVDGTAERSLVHITHHINADVSAEEFSSVVFEAFSKMKNDTLQLESQDEGSPENFIIVGLHTCGDLAPTLLRVFTQCRNAVGIVSVGCCYMKLSHELAMTDQPTTTVKTQVLRSYLNKLDSTRMCRGLEENGDKNKMENTNSSAELCGSSEQDYTDLKSGQNSTNVPDNTARDATDFADPSWQYIPGDIGCDMRQNYREVTAPKERQNSTKIRGNGNDKSTEFTDPNNRQISANISDNLGQNSIENTGAKSKHSPAIQCADPELKILADTSSVQDERIIGYPMSGYVRSLSSHRQTYNALEAACHAICRYHKKLLEVSPTLKLHSYRALLEMLLKHKNPGSHRWQIRSLRTKKAAKMTFAEYATSACDILGIEDGRPTTQDMNDAEELHIGKEMNVVVFYVLRLLMAPVVEGLILVDRLMYIREKHPDIDARISKIFDPSISPRNYAIIADKLPRQSS